jgi:hypothetical protein
MPSCRSARCWRVDLPLSTAISSSESQPSRILVGSQSPIVGDMRRVTANIRLFVPCFNDLVRVLRDFTAAYYFRVKSRRSSIGPGSKPSISPVRSTAVLPVAAM